MQHSFMNIYCVQVSNICHINSFTSSMDDLSVALNNSGIGGYLGDAFLVVFSFFEKTTYCCRSRRLSVRLSSVEIISFRGSSLSNRPIDLKIGLNVPG